MKEILEFVQDDERVREERRKAKKNKDKYVGMNADNLTSSSFSRSSYDRDTYHSSNYKNATSSSSFHDLDDKEWRSNNPSLQDRITDITSKVKDILDKAKDFGDDQNANDEDDDELNTQHPPRKPSITNNDWPKSSTNASEKNDNSVNSKISSKSIKSPITDKGIKLNVNLALKELKTPDQTKKEIDLLCALDNDSIQKNVEDEFGDFVSTGDNNAVELKYAASNFDLLTELNPTQVIK